MRQGYILSPLLLNVYIDAVMKDFKIEMGRRGESGDYLASCMQITWFCMLNLRGPEDDGRMVC